MITTKRQQCIIGLTGRKHSGKDEVFKCIVSLYPNLKVKRMAFADTLKEEVSHAVGMSVEEMEARKEVFRPIYQWWGTEFRRNIFGKDYWTTKLLNKVMWATDTDIIVVPDVRFVNEAEVLRNINASIIRVIRPELPYDPHDSETEMGRIKMDTIIDNSGDLKQLRKTTEKALRLLTKI